VSAKARKKLTRSASTRAAGLGAFLRQKNAASGGGTAAAGAESAGSAGSAGSAVSADSAEGSEKTTTTTGPQSESRHAVVADPRGL
jgi:hypothetical protein